MSETDFEEYQLDDLKNEYLDNGEISLKSLSIKYGIPYKIVLKTSKEEDWHGERERKKSQPIQNTNGSTDGHIEINGKAEAPQNPHLKANEGEELEHLRRQAFELASNAARSLHMKEDWNPKDFDLLVGTYVKVVGAKVKIEGASDVIDRLLGELTESDEFQHTSSDREDDRGES
jgi:hypothetical protein